MLGYFTRSRPHINSPDFRGLCRPTFLRDTFTNGFTVRYPDSPQRLTFTELKRAEIRSKIEGMTEISFSPARNPGMGYTCARTYVFRS